MGVERDLPPRAHIKFDHLKYDFIIYVIMVSLIFIIESCMFDFSRDAQFELGIELLSRYGFSTFSSAAPTLAPKILY